ncbi:hypothetical protein C8J56DRAFT_1022918 [Mycena floridula]|nr:hypothetical protein C8J56DRAFT_1022918 [Mycena floridula]
MWNINNPNEKPQRMCPGDVAAAVVPFFRKTQVSSPSNDSYYLFQDIYGLVVNVMEFLQSAVRFRHPSVAKFGLSHIKYLLSGAGAASLSGDILLQVAKLLPNASVGQGYGNRSMTVSAVSGSGHTGVTEDCLAATCHTKTREIGLTETSTAVLVYPADQNVSRPGSSGVLAPGCTARVVKPDGSLAAEGELGELVIKSPSNALKYLNDEEASKSTFVDGWVHTGDQVMMKDNELYIVDRLKEMIKVKGFQVAPRSSTTS